MAARLLKRLRGDDSGLAATEFAMLAPVLVFMALAASDLSGALDRRMAVDHVLRAGAQAAMADPGTATVRAVMQGAAEGFRLGDGTGGTLALTATLRCACPDAPQTATSCTTICAGSQPTTISYLLGAGLRYDARLLPDMIFSPALEVEIR